jgi:hypothetical protein
MKNILTRLGIMTGLLGTLALAATDPTLAKSHHRVHRFLPAELRPTVVESPFIYSWSPWDMARQPPGGTCPIPDRVYGYPGCH